MPDAYVDVTVFAIAALLVPVILLVISRAFGPRGRPGRAAGVFSEAGRSAQGQGIAVEYAHYLSLFLMFCVVASVIVIWSFSVRSLDMVANLRAEFLLVFAFVLCLVVLALNRFGR